VCSGKVALTLALSNTRSRVFETEANTAVVGMRSVKRPDQLITSRLSATRDVVWDGPAFVSAMVCRLLE
jgi:hypothetical protein